jgi:hypothetical protein
MTPDAANDLLHPTDIADDAVACLLNDQRSRLDDAATRLGLAAAGQMNPTRSAVSSRVGLAFLPAGLDVWALVRDRPSSRCRDGAQALVLLHRSISQWGLGLTEHVFGWNICSDGTNVPPGGSLRARVTRRGPMADRGTEALQLVLPMAILCAIVLLSLLHAPTSIIDALFMILGAQVGHRVGSGGKGRRADDGDS